MFNIKKAFALTAPTFIAGIAVDSYAAPACALFNGLESLPIPKQIQVSGTDPGNWHDNAWKEIAKEAQKTYQNKVSANPAAGFVVITVNVKASVLGISVPATFNSPIDYYGGESLEKAILNSRGIDSEKPDPVDCRPVGEEKEIHSITGNVETVTHWQLGSSGSTRTWSTTMVEVYNRGSIVGGSLPNGSHSWKVYKGGYWEYHYFDVYGMGGGAGGGG